MADATPLEKEQEDQKQLLEPLRINYSDLRNCDVLAAMVEIFLFIMKWHTRMDTGICHQ